MQALRVLTNFGSFHKEIFTMTEDNKKKIHNLLVLVIPQSFNL